MKYKIHKEATDPKDIVIEKTGHKIHFTMREVERTQKVNADNKTNIEAKMKMEKAKLDNIERNHKFVTEMSDQDLHTVYMYFEAKKIVEMAEAKLTEFEKNEKELAKELKDIAKQIPNLNETKEDTKTEDKGE